MTIGRSWYIFLSWKDWNFIFNRFDFNDGGVLNGGSPYQHWQIGPLNVKKYI